MDPVFFLQNNFVEKITIPVAKFAREHSIPMEDRSSSTTFSPEDCGIEWLPSQYVIPFGSVQFIRRLKDSRLGEFVMHDNERFSFGCWERHFGEHLLNHGCSSANASEVPSLLGKGRFHLRPESHDKAFVGGIYDATAWDKLLSERDISPGLVCCLAQVRNILEEWRFWIVDGIVIECSRYRKDNEKSLSRETSNELLSIAQHFADMFLPYKNVVMDLARTDEGIRIVEFNPIHCSGWYAADINNILEAMVAFARKQSVRTSAT